jgi:hypothetical protein
MRTTVLPNPRDGTWTLLNRLLIGAALFLGMLLVGVQVARSSEAPSSLVSSPASSA